jgi:hypothetical protein
MGTGAPLTYCCALVTFETGRGLPQSKTLRETKAPSESDRLW